MVKAIRGHKAGLSVPLGSLLLLVQLAGWAPTAKADTLYTYTGQPFTNFSLLNCPGEGHCGFTKNSSFTLPTPLGPNLTGVSIAPSSFTFTDGATAWSSTPAAAQFVNTLVQFNDIDTNAAGNLTSWNIQVVTQQIGCEPLNCATLFMGIINDPDGAPANVGDAIVAHAGFQFAGAVSSSLAGTWCTANVPCGGAPPPGPPPGAPVPEPNTLLLLGTGLIGAVGALRRRLLG